MTSIKTSTAPIRGGTEVRHEFDYDDDGSVDRTEIVRDFDYDNDGVTDNHVEVTEVKLDLDGSGKNDDTITTTTVDSDGDGDSDHTITRVDREVDSNSDGVTDTHYTDITIDTDGDGNADSEVHERTDDLDTNSDGVVDGRKRTTRTVFDDNDDGTPDRGRDVTVIDTDGDGLYDQVTVDGPYDIKPEPTEEPTEAPTEEPVKEPVEELNPLDYAPFTKVPHPDTIFTEGGEEPPKDVDPPTIEWIDETDDSYPGLPFPNTDPYAEDVSPNDDSTYSPWNDEPWEDSPWNDEPWEEGPSIGLPLPTFGSEPDAPRGGLPLPTFPPVPDQPEDGLPLPKVSPYAEGVLERAEAEEQSNEESEDLHEPMGFNENPEAEVPELVMEEHEDPETMDAVFDIEHPLDLVELPPQAAELLEQMGMEDLFS